MTLFRCQHCSGGSSEASDQGRAHQNASGHDQGDFHDLSLEKQPSKLFVTAWRLDEARLLEHGFMPTRLGQDALERSGSKSGAWQEERRVLAW